MLCAISGTQTSDPVVSPKSGGIFDRKLALTYVATSGKDPLNDEPLTVDELISVSSGGTPVVSAPKPAEFHSIPTMLAAFQDEWDALALEMFTLRKQLQNTREELSTTLYKYDAAVRVAARATKEKEEAQQALQQIAETFAAKSGGEGDDNDAALGTLDSAPEAHETPDYAAVLGRAREALFALHKRLKLLLPVTPKSTVSVVKTEKTAGITCPLALAVNTANREEIVTSAAESIHLPLGQKSGAFSAVAFLNEAGGAVPMGMDEQGLEVLTTQEKHVFAIKNVRRMLTHPSEPFFVAIASDETWVFGDKNGVVHVSEPQDAIFAADVHVDGMLLGLAVPGRIDIVDLTSRSVVSSIEAADLKTVSSIQFALNGYWLFVAGTTDAERGQVRIYDLRKSSLAHTFMGSADMEFVVDTSCQVLLVCDKTNQKLHIHLYAKKGKKWIEDVYAEDCGALHSLTLASSPDDTQLRNAVTLAGLHDDNVVYFDISLC